MTYHASSRSPVLEAALVPGDLPACSPSIAGVITGETTTTSAPARDQPRHPALRHVPAADDHHAATGEPQARGVRRVVAHCPGDPRRSRTWPSPGARRRRTRRSGSASTAPVPSPSRRSRSTSGRRPSAASATAWPGSTLRCPATAVVDGVGRQGLRDEGGGAGDHAVEHHRHPPAAAPRTSPASPACSKPPTAASVEHRVVASTGRSAAAAATTSVLRASVASSMPVPRPVTGRGARPAGERCRQADDGWCWRCPCRR